MNAQTSFTPGPWEADDGDGQYFGIFADSADGEAIAYLAEPAPRGYVGMMPLPLRGFIAGDEVYEHWSEHKANARLIAAAPRLYEALEALNRDARPVNWEDDEEAAAAWRLLDAALAEAVQP